MDVQGTIATTEEVTTTRLMLDDFLRRFKQIGAFLAELA